MTGLLEGLLRLGDLVAQGAGPLVVLVGDRLVLVALQRLDPALELTGVGVRGLRAQPLAGARLVDEVDGLVGQEPVGDVALGELAAAVRASSVNRTWWCAS